MNYNKAVIVGRLTRDPESRALPSGQPVTNFSLATNRVWTGQDGNKQESTEFHNIVAFGKLAEICSSYLAKGRLVLVEGRIQTRSWQDQDGNKRYRTEIIADNMQMGPRPEGSASQLKEPISKQTPAPTDEEIPVIDAEEPIEAENANAGNETSENAELPASNEKEEVDVKNIPF